MSTGEAEALACTPTAKLRRGLQDAGWHEVPDNPLLWEHRSGVTVTVPSDAHQHENLWAVILRRVAAAESTTSWQLASSLGLPPARCESCGRVAPCSWVRLRGYAGRAPETFGVCEGCRASSSHLDDM